MSLSPCPSFPGYCVTADGRAFTQRRRTRVPGMPQGGTVVIVDPAFVRELRQHTGPKGYRLVSVSTVAGQRAVGVHRLVADAFRGPCPAGQQVRHLDGNPANNMPGNLAYGTCLDNAADRLRHGRYATGERHHNAKLSDEQATSIRDLRRSGTKVRVLSAQFGVSVPTIEGVIYGKTFRRVEAAS